MNIMATYELDRGLVPRPFGLSIDMVSARSCNVTAAN